MKPISSYHLKHLSECLNMDINTFCIQKIKYHLKDYLTSTKEALSYFVEDHCKPNDST